MTKTFYRLSEASEGVGRKFPQIQEISAKIDIDTKKRIEFLLADADRMLPGCKIQGLVVSNDSILTDVLSCVYMNQYDGILCNQSFLTLLEGFNIIKHDLYHIEIEHRGNCYSYFWLAFKETLVDYVNFSKSKFYLSDPLGDKIGDLSIESKEQLLKIQKTAKAATKIKAESFVLRQHSFDLFQIGGWNFQIYVSPGLRDHLEKNKITGIEFRESKLRIE
jgi:hypothetical protein